MMRLKNLLTSMWMLKPRLRQASVPNTPLQKKNLQMGVSMFAAMMAAIVGLVFFQKLKFPPEVQAEQSRVADQLREKDYLQAQLKRAGATRDTSVARPKQTDAAAERLLKQAQPASTPSPSQGEGRGEGQSSRTSDVPSKPAVRSPKSSGPNAEALEPAPTQPPTIDLTEKLKTARVNVEGKKLAAGLIESFGYTSDVGHHSVVQRVVARPTLLLNAGEVYYPVTYPAPSFVRWNGYLTINRGGSYRLSCKVQGFFRVKIGNVTVLEANAVTSAEQSTSPLSLEAGTYRLDIELYPARTGQPLPTAHEREQIATSGQRMQIFWESEHFVREPIYPAALSHDVAFGPSNRLRNDAALDLIREHRCMSCHPSEKSGQPLASPILVNAGMGPNLEVVAERGTTESIARWLASPEAVRPHTTMPRLFADDDKGEAERVVVAHYLSSISGKPIKDDPSSRTADASKDPNDPKANKKAKAKKKDSKPEVTGDKLFASLGCLACHRTDDDNKPADATQIPLTHLASKTTPSALTDYLLDPGKKHPDAKMPAFVLSKDDARKLAEYMLDDLAVRKPETKSLPSLDAASARLGLSNKVDRDAAASRLLESKGCFACHQIDTPKAAKPKVKPATPWEKLSADKGCLADKPDAMSISPRFALSDSERKDIATFRLAAGPEFKSSANAPLYEARVVMQRLRCANCHQTDTGGGMDQTVAKAMHEAIAAKNADELTLPPSLKGVGSKLRPAYLDRVFREHARARPWASVQMPRFASHHVHDLGSLLVRMEGAEPDNSIHQLAFKSSDVEDGRYLVSRRAFGCMACHALAGVRQSGGGVRAPDLAETRDRVPYDWFKRWLLDPQRLDPGTKMPSHFVGGKSSVTSIHEGDPNKQVDALWSYFSLGKNVPLPPGNEPPAAIPLRVTDTPMVMRTFMPTAGVRAFAVGDPDQLAYVFDADRGRVAYAWAGDFLDAGPTWANRGGGEPTILGKTYFVGAKGFPWQFQDYVHLPDFNDMWSKPTYGGFDTLDPPSSIHRHLRFEGHDLDAKGLPVFHLGLYHPIPIPGRVAASWCELTLRVKPKRSGAGLGIASEWQIDQLSSAQTGWLFAGRSSTPPSVVLSDGQTKPMKIEAMLERGKNRINVLDESTGTPATDPILLFDGERTQIVMPIVGGIWHATKSGDGYELLVRIPDCHKRTVTLETWSPFRQDPACYRDIIAPKPAADR